MEKKQRQEERRLLEEEKGILEQERRKLEEARRAELDRKRQEKEKIKKFNMLVAEAEQAANNKDKELAMTKYREALLFYPNSPIVDKGLKEVKKLMDKFCYEMIGIWYRKDFMGGIMIRIMENGKFFHGNTDNYPTSWECYPEKKQIKDNALNYIYTLGQDGTCLSLGDYQGESWCYRKQQ